MTLPSKRQQIEAVAKFLDSDRNEGRSLEEIAGDIVDGYLSALTRDIKKPTQPVRLGMLFKMPIDAKARRVAWIEGGAAWCVTEDASYGFMTPVDGDVWQCCEEYRPKRRQDGKMVEMSDDDIAEAWSNPDWKVGDRVSIAQRQCTFVIIATGPKCVLMRNTKTDAIQSDSNSNLAKYYRRELMSKEVIW